MNTHTGHRGILTLTLKDRAALYEAYLPFMKNGALFVPSAERYRLGDEVFMLVTLPESSERLPVAGKVVWTTPVGAQGGRSAGIGVQLPEGEQGDAVRNRVESLLVGLLDSERPTLTM